MTGDADRGCIARCVGGTGLVRYLHDRSNRQRMYLYPNVYALRVLLYQGERIGTRRFESVVFH